MEVFYKKNQKPKMYNTYIENEDYVLVKISNTVEGVKLLLDDYKDVVYHYHRVKVREEDGVGKMDFGYSIIEPGSYDIDELNSNSDFHKIMGDILTTILLNEIEYAQNRNDNLKESSFE